MNYFKTYKKQLIAILILLPLIGLGVYLALNQTLLRSRASQGSVTFAPETVTKKPGEDVVITLNVNPNGASAVGVSAVVNFNADLLSITPADITQGSFGELAQKTVEVNGNQGKIILEAVNFNQQQKNYHTPAQVATVFASLNFKAKNTTGTAALSLGDILVVAPGNNQTISVGKGSNANITISGQGLPRVAVGSTLINSDPRFNQVCQVKGWTTNCIFDTISHIDGWDKPWQNEEFITADGNWWVFEPVKDGQLPAPKTGELKIVYGATSADVCYNDANCKLTSVAQFKAYDSSSQNDLLIIKGDKYWIYKPVDANDQRPAPVSGSVSDIDGVSQACSGLTNCQVQSVSHYKDFDKSNENYSFVVASGTANGQPSTRYAIVPGLLQNGQVQSSRGQIISGDLMQFAEIQQLCGNNPNCSIRTFAQFRGFDSSTQNQDLITGFVNGQGKFIVRNGLNSLTTNRPTPPAAGSPTVPSTVACSLSVNRTTGRATDDFTFTLNSPALAGAGIPSGSNLVWQGKNNGQDIPSSAAGTSTSSPQILGTFKGSDFGSGNFERYVQVLRNGSQICQTVPVTITVSSAVPATTSLSANIVNSTQGEVNNTAAGSVGVNFPAGKFTASALVPNTSSDNITATGMYIVKVDPQTMLPVTNPTWNCAVNGIANPIVNVTDASVPSSFRTRYCVIADSVSGQKQFLNNITSKAFSVSEAGTYIALIDANAGPTKLECTGAPSQWGSLPGKTACSSSGGGFITVTVAAGSADVVAQVQSIIANYGQTINGTKMDSKQFAKVYFGGQ